MHSGLWWYVKGLAMGAADVVPGVSGGTIAFITGIYDRLIQAISSIDGQALRLLWQRRFRAFWSHVDGWFLLVLALGIATSFVGLAQLIKHLLATYPVLLWAFFCGLMLVSVPLVLRRVADWHGHYWILLLGGVAIGVAVSVLTPTQTPATWWFLGIAGAIAICAMILPGISGSFLLLILGQYSVLITAVAEFDVLRIAIFMIGAFIGLLLFSRVLKKLLARWHDPTVVVLGGIMAGAIVRIWPWQNVTSTYTSSNGAQKPLTTEWVMPDSFVGEPYTLWAVVTFFAAIVIVWCIDTVAHRHGLRDDQDQVEK